MKFKKKPSKYQKKKKTSRVHGDLSNSLIECAVEYIQENKSTQFALRELASKLGVSHAAAYRHFKSKQELVEAIALRGYQKMNFLFSEKLIQNSKPLVSLGEAYIQFAINSPGYYRVMFSMNFSESNNEDLKNECKKSFGALINIFGNLDKKSVAKAIFSWSVVHGYSMLIIDSQTGPPLKEFGFDKVNFEELILKMAESVIQT